MIRYLQIKLLVLFTFCCAMRLWQYYVGVRLMAFDIFMAAFAGLCLFAMLHQGRVRLPQRSLRLILGAYVIILALSYGTFFCLQFGSRPEVIPQFFKGAINLTLHVTALCCVIIYLACKPPELTCRIVRVYIAGAVASSLYSFAEVLCAYAGFDLGKAIFATISIYPPDFDLEAPFYYEWDVFFRAAGFPGVNAQATYAASVVPLLLIGKPFSPSRRNYIFAAICLAGSLLTFSRNGVLTLVIASVTFALIRPGLLVRLAPRFAIALVPLVILCIVFWRPLASVAGTRMYQSIEQVGSGRFEIYEAAWKAIVRHPLGHGINQFAVIVQFTDQIDVSKIEVKYFTWSEERVRAAYANLHSNWLNWLFEGGWPLLISYIAFYSVALAACWNARNTQGQASICTLFGLLVSGLFNMTLDQFSTELLFVLLPCWAVAVGRIRSNDMPRGHLTVASREVPC